MIDLGGVIPVSDKTDLDEFPNKGSRSSFRRSNSTTSLHQIKPCYKYNNSFSSLISEKSHISLNDDNIISNMNIEMEAIRKQNARLRKHRDKAVSSLRSMQTQQKQLYEDFQLLRDKYDDLKLEMHRILWEYIPKHCSNEPIENNPCFNELAKVDPTVFETDNQIGDYNIGQLLGEGQFADVKLCTHTITKRLLAVKVLQKSKVVTLSNLQRIQTEINVLRKLNHPNIVTLVNVIHSPRYIYVMTELAGRDLFDFFDANPMGVRGKTAREIIIGIVEPIVYLHSLGICHRDLKPENILLFCKPSSSYHSNTTECDRNNINPITRRHIQICDFGQSAQNVKPGECSLDDLCGSPGFFAPEMILGGERHSGIAADVWSIGCIMLELTRGHDEFCKTWMTCYDYEIMQDESKFESALKQAICYMINYESISDECTAVDENPYILKSMAQFLSQILIMDPTIRLDSRSMMSQPWLNDQISMNEMDHVNFQVAQSVSFEALNDYENNSNAKELSFKESKHGTKTKKMDLPKKNRFLRDSMSKRARRHFGGSIEFITDTTITKDKTSSAVLLSWPPTKKRLISESNSGIDLRLPPIDKTPSSDFKTKGSSFHETDLDII